MDGTEFLALAKARKSTYEFSEEPVSDEEATQVLEAARWAPSSLNSQPWSFIVVRDPRRIDALMGCCHYGFFHTNPPVLIAIILEPLYVDRKALLRGSAKEFAESHRFINIAFPTLNMIYEAAALGLASCILSPSREADALLKVPDASQAILFVGLGREKEDAHQQPRARKEMREIVFREEYGRR